MHWLIKGVTEILFMKTMLNTRSLMGALIFLLTFACKPKGPADAHEYQPLFSADTLEKNTLVFGFPSFSYSKSAEKLIKYINANSTGFHVKMKACISYDEYVGLLKQKKFDVTVIGGIEALAQPDSNYTIVGKISNDEAYSSVMFSRRNAGIIKVSDLKGKKVALVPSKALGSMMPLYYLHNNGLDVNHDIVRVNVSSFESAIIATYLGKSDAGMCLKRNWNVYVANHPEILSKVVLNWETPPLINNALLFKKGIDSTTMSQLKALLFSISNSPDGKMALDEVGVSGFEKANRNTFTPLLEFQKRYDSVIL